MKFINTKGKLGEQKKFNMNLSAMTMLHSWLLFTLYNMLSDLSNSLPGYMCCVCSEVDNQWSPFASQIMYSNEVFVHKLFSMNFTAMATQNLTALSIYYSFYFSELPFSKLRTSPSPLLFFFFFKDLFIFGCGGSLLLAPRLSLVATGSGYFLLWCAGSSLGWLLQLQ